MYLLNYFVLRSVRRLRKIQVRHHDNLESGLQQQDKVGKSENYLGDKTDRIWHLGKRGGKLVVRRKRKPPST